MNGDVKKEVVKKMFKRETRQKKCDSKVSISEVTSIEISFQCEGQENETKHRELINNSLARFSRFC